MPSRRSVAVFTGFPRLGARKANVAELLAPGRPVRAYKVPRRCRRVAEELDMRVGGWGRSAKKRERSPDGAPGERGGTGEKEKTPFAFHGSATGVTSREKRKTPGVFPCRR